MKRNTLTTAVLAGLTGVAGMASVAHAVNVNPDGLGQVLLYPYYSVRGGNDTLISIVNTHDEAKAVKIRFIEALNSREVLDFNIYMSPFDVWAAGVTETEDGAGGRVVFSDTTCTTPYLLVTKGGSQEFLPNAYAGGNTDGGPDGLDRTKSGYIEVIEMGVLTGDAAAATEHTSEGVPPVSGTTAAQGVCGLFTERWIDASAANGNGIWVNDPSFEIDDPAGGLFGSGALINVDNGTMFSYNATALDAFWATGEDGHTDPGNLQPSLAGSSNTVSNVFINGSVSTVDWQFSIDAVNAALTVEKLMNEYAVEESIGGNSEWIVTFPTKRFHTDGPGEGLAAPIEPFTSLWTLDKPWACEALDLNVWDREEQTPGPDFGGVIVSPQPEEPEDVFELCRESNVIRFANDGSLPDFAEITGEPSANVTAGVYSYVNFGLPEAFDAGWARFDFSDRSGRDGQDQDSGLLVESVGLPVVGFWANTFTNSNVVDGVLANYGGAYQHRGSRVFPQSAD